MSDASRLAVRAEQARRRRHAKGARPRTEAYARTKPWLAEGVSRTAWFEARRRRDDAVATAPSAAPAADLSLDDFVAGDSPAATEVEDATERPSDDFVASPLARRVCLLPGGSDPAFLANLERLVTDAPAARAAWAEYDPALADLLAADDCVRITDATP